MIDGARDQGVSDQKFINAPAENAGAIKEKVGARIFGIFGFYSLPIRRAAFSAFIQAKGRLIGLFVLERQEPRVFGPPSKPSAWLVAGGKALGELGANPQLELNCYRWY